MVTNSTPSLTSYNLEQLFKLSEPWFLYLKNEEDNAYLIALEKKEIGQKT